MHKCLHAHQSKNNHQTNNNMRKSISIIRIAVLFALGIIGSLFLFSEEHDENQLIFWLHLLFDKAIGFLMYFVFYKLYSRWSKLDRWIMAYEQWISKDNA